jgi:hypothetical protein
MTPAGDQSDVVRPRPAALGARMLADRGLVLMIGVAVGLAIGAAFQRPAPRPPASPHVVLVAKPPAAVAAPDCALTVAPRLVEELATGKPAVIGVFGDSFGDGLWTALYRRMQTRDVKIERFSQEGTGFTRYQVLDVEKEAARRLREQPVDVAVVVFGANDTEGLWDDDHRHAYAFMTPAWQTIYGARMARLVARLRAQQAMVYWVGLPRMRKPDYDADVAAEDAFYEREASSLGVPYFDTRTLSVDETGGFNMYLADGPSGARRLMRANDGVHMTGVGYERLAGPLMQRIRAYLDRAGAQARGPLAASS